MEADLTEINFDLSNRSNLNFKPNRTDRVVLPLFESCQWNANIAISVQFYHIVKREAGSTPSGLSTRNSVLMRTHRQHANATIDLTVAERMFDLTDDDSMPANPRTGQRPEDTKQHT